MRISRRGLSCAVAVTMALPAVAFAVPALAHDEPGVRDREVERVIIIDDEDGDRPAVHVRREPGKNERVVIVDRRGPGAGPEARSFRIERDGREVRSFRIERVGRRGRAYRIERGGPEAHAFQIERGGPGARAFAIERGGPGALLADCGGGRSEVDESSANGAERTRVVICGRDGPGAAMRAERLERALARINANEHLSAEHKARVSEALREALEEVRRTAP
jgi:hypothetical protein